MSGEHLDLSSDPNPPRPPPARGFLGVHFACCGLYSRVYLNREGTEYVGRCPKCMAQAKFVIGEGGHGGRFFSVS
ncbi:MAG: hypothetical protein KY475_27240 [Planctomycetes bacterium]|nr:hypothetical protein [Planctomycetota bacterium]